MLTIDLNCDLGEGCGNDASLMEYISSANIACGGHAGDRRTMETTARLAVERGVAIGAHPGYRDKENFGRIALQLSGREVFDLVVEQVEEMLDVCRVVGAEMRHVKPHGALYNQAAKDRELAAAIAEAVRSVDEDLIVFGLSGSVSLVEAERAGMETAAEVFGDRGYMPDGTLVPRSQSGALIDDTARSVEQVLRMVRDGEVAAIDGSVVKLRAETVCLHGDGANALEFAGAIREALQEAKIGVAAPPRAETRP
jgi:5-oxoprolinase (ATP-hydrolysing) subunit A